MSSSARVAKWCMLAAAACLLAVALAACGNSDDPAPAATPTPIQPKAQLSNAVGSDQDFVASVCSASNSLVTVLQSMFQAGSGVTDFEKLSASLNAPLTEFIAKFAAANPPADLVSWHRDATVALEGVASQISTGQGFDKLFGDSPIPTLPGDAQTRLTPLLGGQQNCIAANFALGTGGRGGSLDRALGGGRRERTPRAGQ